jgi:hypothetical protein
MRYPELLNCLQKLGFDEVKRYSTESVVLAVIASDERPRGGEYPFAFPNLLILLENGDESELDEEVVDSAMRWATNQPRRC